MSEKTEQPSPQRLRDARRKGQLPRSKLLSASATTFGALAVFLSLAPASAERMRAWTVALLSGREVSPQAALTEALVMLGYLAGPVLAGALAASFLVSVASAGFQLNAEVLAPKLERVDPFAGFKRLFSPRQLVEIAKALAVTAIIGLVVWSAVKDAAPAVFRAVRLEGAGSLLVALRLIAPVLLRCAAIILLLGAGDYLLARRRHIKDLMMTREECKQENKDSEGDPHQKGKRKALHKALAVGGPARGVHKATAVVVNPTHIAVALRYDERECEAPYIVARAREEDALKLRREAKRLGIPVVKDIPLARSLIHYDVGEEIPEELYKAAAAILKVALDKQSADQGPAKEMP
ncbi:MAG: EscU/YscU/HrcU family type III secretion system export apparatus switch protein [Myxococcaceae bacterium]